MTKRFFCFLLLSICVHAKVSCQAFSNAIDGKPILSGLWYLPEGNRSLSITEVEKKWQAGAFDTLAKTTLNFGRSNQRYWLHFQLAKDAPPELLLELSNAFLYNVELYYNSGLNNTLLYQTGINFSFNHRPVTFRHFILPLLNKKGTSDYYLLIDRRNELMRFSLQFYTAEKFQTREINDALFFGLIFGILFFIALFNIVLWLLIKDAIHLWYLAYISFILLFIAADNGFGYQWLWSSLPFVQKYIRNFLSLAAFIVQLRFMQLFLGQTITNSRYYSWTKRIITTSTVLIPIILIASILDADNIAIPAPLVGIVQMFFYGCFLAGICVLFLSSYEKIKNRQRVAWIYLLAMLPLMIQVLVVMLSRWHIVTIDIDTALLFAIAVLLEIMILGMGMALRYNRLRQEKNELSHKLARQQHLSIKKVLEAQDAERQRIAADLHDHLGSTLSTVKGMLSGLPHTGSIGVEIKLEQAQSILGDACQDLRNIAHNLMPAGFEDMTLAEVLEESVAKANDSGTIRFLFMTLGEPISLNKETCLGLVRIANELIHNIIRHSQATEATLQLLWHPDMMELIVEDNGHGFNPDKLSTGLAGIGIKSIYSRAEYINAEIRYDSNSQGTTVICTLPR